MKKEHAIQIIEHFENLLNFHSTENVQNTAWWKSPGKDQVRLQDTCEIFTVKDMGWNALENGDLINGMQKDGFDYLITPDKNLPYQQTLVRILYALLY